MCLLLADMGFHSGATGQTKPAKGNCSVKKLISRLDYKTAGTPAAVILKIMFPISVSSELVFVANEPRKKFLIVGYDEVAPVHN